VKVLCCGGSLDGQWREVSAAVSEFRNLKPYSFNWSQDEKVVNELEYEQYRVVPLSFLGYQLKVALVWNRTSVPDEEIILKALVQRDVFEVMTNPGRKRGG
jgi:hypothetical protein